MRRAAALGVAVGAVAAGAVGSGCGPGACGGDPVAGVGIWVAYGRDPGDHFGHLVVRLHNRGGSRKIVLLPAGNATGTGMFVVSEIATGGDPACAAVVLSGRFGSWRAWVLEPGATVDASCKAPGSDPPDALSGLIIDEATFGPLVPSLPDASGELPVLTGTMLSTLAASKGAWISGSGAWTDPAIPLVRRQMHALDAATDPEEDVVVQLAGAVSFMAPVHPANSPSACVP